MGRWYPERSPRYTPRQPTPEEPRPPQEPAEGDKALLANYHLLRLSIAELEEKVGDDKSLDKAVVCLKVGAKLVKKRLRQIGFKGPLRTKEPATYSAKVSS